MRYGIRDVETGAALVGQLEPMVAERESLTSQVFDAIRDAIVTKRLSPGMRLSEALLARQLNVSKTPVRESLLRLKNLGLVVAHGTRGLQVIEPDEHLILQAYEVRAGLESFASRMAADRADPSAKAALTEAASGSLACAEVCDAGGRQKWDQTFHYLVSETAANPRLSALIRDQYLLTWALRQRDTRGAIDNLDCANQHIEVAEAIGSGDGIAASEAMFEHLMKLRRLVLEAHRASEANPSGAQAPAILDPEE